MRALLATDAANARRLADRLTESVLDSDATVAAFEDADGRWIVEIHFNKPSDHQVLRALVGEALGEDATRALAFDTVAAKDWVAASLAELKPVRAGRFIVHGAHDRAAVPANRIGIEIEAALAFGTGHHGTTRGCLLALDRIAKANEPRRVLDVGTGTGVLAVAAAKMLRRRVLASDIDKSAVIVARGNTRANHTGRLIDVVQAAGLSARTVRQRGPFDLVLANILLGPLKLLAHPMARLLTPNAHVVLSGLLTSQTKAALAAYRVHGLRLEQRIVLDGWVTLVMARKAARKIRTG
jgi:ribosomal protein L11 methyltransferase